MRALQRAAMVRPEHPRLFCQLGELLQRLGWPHLAKEALRRHVQNSDTFVRRRGGDVPEFSSRLALGQHLLAALERRAPARAPEAYVRSLFDRYAPRFEEHALRQLAYRVPAELAEELRSTLAEQRAKVCVHDAVVPRRVLDLGAGTGLLGLELRALAPDAQLEAVDLSAGMLSQALAKGCYDRLLHGDLEAAFAVRQAPEPNAVVAVTAEEAEAEHTPRHEGGDLFDVVAGADVLPYLGDLSKVLRLARHWLQRSSGLFGLSFEAACETEGDAMTKRGYRLCSSGRYEHSCSYVKAQAAAHEFEVVRDRPVILRLDAGMPVYGYIFVLRSQE